MNRKKHATNKDEDGDKLSSSDFESDQSQDGELSNDGEVVSAHLYENSKNIGKSIAIPSLNLNASKSASMSPSPNLLK